MENKKKANKYTSEFKQTIVSLYQSRKTYLQIKNEYGVYHNEPANWIKQYSGVKIDDKTIITTGQIKDLQERNAQIEEENLILKINCNIHATFKQRLNAFKTLFQKHSISTLAKF